MRDKGGWMAGWALALACASEARAQSAASTRAFDEALALYNQGNYNDALVGFDRALKSAPDHAAALYFSANTLRMLQRYEDAIARWERLAAVQPGFEGEYYRYLWGLAADARGDLPEAARAYSAFLQRGPDRPAMASVRQYARARVRYAEQSPELRAASLTPGVEAPRNLGPGVNSAWKDEMPNTDPTGRTIYFMSTREGGFPGSPGNRIDGWQDDVWRVGSDGAGWGSPQLLPAPINSTGHDGAASFSGDGQRMVYAVCGRSDGIGDCDLSESVLEGTSWSAPRNLGNVVNSPAWDSQPTVSADGARVIFSSERPGGAGASDLYETRRGPDGAWTVAVNLGPVVNTPGREHAPSLGPDGRTLYFASDTHPGHGGFDLFVTVWEDGVWRAPVNLGSPINQAGDDRFFTIGGDGKTAYLASDRPGGLGGTDLYAVAVPESLRPTPTAVVSGVVTDDATDRPLGAVVMVEDISTGALIATQKSNAATGAYLVVLPVGRDYSVSATASGYFFDSDRFTLASDAKYQEITRNIALSPIQTGSKVVLHNVFFATGEATLSPESQVELRRLVELLRNNPKMVVEVGGHTDDVGDATSNLRLSHARAEAVRQFVLGQGVSGARVQAKGYGQTSPVAPNDTEEGRRANRRTEMIILEG